MLMANNKMYENYLMHYRTPGSKNGYTKYPDKYTPVGEKASMNQNIYAGPAATAGVGKGVYGAHKIQNLYNAPAMTVNASKQRVAESRRLPHMESNIKLQSPDYSKIFANSVKEPVTWRNQARKQLNTVAKKGRDFTDFVVEDIADRAKRGASNAKDFGGFMAKDIASRAKSAAKKGRDFTDFVVEDNIDRAKKLVGKGKKKVSKLLKKFF